MRLFPHGGLLSWSRDLPMPQVPSASEGQDCAPSGPCSCPLGLDGAEAPGVLTLGNVFTASPGVGGAGSGRRGREVGEIQAHRPHLLSQDNKEG